MDKLWCVIEQLQQGKHLPVKHRPHKLTGNWAPYTECHIEPDWLLIYDCSDVHLELIRTGSHADLFD